LPDHPGRIVRLPYRVLFLCTGNSARSQIAEAVLGHRGRGRFVAESAGSRPAEQVHPLAIEALETIGTRWGGRAPRALDAVESQHWDFAITVCDRAREACPIFPDRPVVAHWGMADPAQVAGSVDERRRAFHQALVLLARRVDLFLALPVEKLDRLALEARVRGIGDSGAILT
jgi:arsenate reductase